MKNLFDDEPRHGADFSTCRTWRYWLWRKFAADARLADTVAFIGLNPSTADEKMDDPTVRRCIGFAKAWGFTQLYMLNAYAYRSTDPRGLKQCEDPVGPANDAVIRLRCREAALVVAAWGAHCSPEREREVLAAVGRDVFCLGKTKAGRPRHPLYLPADSERRIFYARPRSNSTDV